MAWEIDRFSGKRSGFNQPRRYIRILVDDNGIISTAGVEGEVDLNLDRLSDYNSVDRRYFPGDLITDFCNTTTHTHYYIRAQDERPFAYTETVINAPECGYLEPLPEPAVPVNPFGNPVYVPYRVMDFCDIDGVNVNVLISSNKYSGLPLPIEVGGKSPVVLSYKEVERFDVFRPVECKLSFVVESNFALEELYANDERSFQVTITKGGQVKFKGYIMPSGGSEAFVSPPYEVNIRATDSIGGLKAVTYPVPVGSTTDIKQSFKDILAYCFAVTNLNLDIITVCNLYEATMPTGLNDDPMSLASINPLRLSNDNGTTLTVYDVLEKVAQAWGAFIVQRDGVWYFVRENELSNPIIRSRRYNYKGLFLYGENLQTKRVIGGVL